MVGRDSIKLWHLLIILILFWGSWVYVEISDYKRRDNFVEEVDAFMHKGDRFTKQRGVALEHRVDDLEKAQEQCDKGCEQ